MGGSPVCRGSLTSRQPASQPYRQTRRAFSQTIAAASAAASAAPAAPPRQAHLSAQIQIQILRPAEARQARGQGRSMTLSRQTLVARRRLRPRAALQPALQQRCRQAGRSATVNPPPAAVSVAAVYSRFSAHCARPCWQLRWLRELLRSGEGSSDRTCHACGTDMLPLLDTVRAAAQVSDLHASGHAISK